MSHTVKSFALVAIAVFAVGVSAACSSTSKPVAKPSSNTAPNPVAKPSYCALRAAADEAGLAQGDESSKGVVGPADVRLAAAAKAVAVAAKADGRADVAAMYVAVAKQALTAKEPTDAQLNALLDLISKGTETVINDCVGRPE